MSRYDRKKEELEREARRARRLAERAEERARRKASQAEKAAERAARLADRVHGRLSDSKQRQSDLDQSIEDFVEEVTEKWSQKAEDWMHRQSGRMSDDNAHDDNAHDDNAHDDNAHDDNEDDLTYEDVGHAGSSLSPDLDKVQESASQARKAARQAERRAAEAEARADRFGYSPYERESSTGRSTARRARRRSSIEMKRKERARRARRRRHTSLRSRLISGRGLYRDPKNKKICGVCAGIADYLAMETWQVRLATLAGVFFMGQIVIPAYFVTYFLLDPKPYYKEVTDRFDEFYDEFDDDDDVRAKVRTYRNKNRHKKPTMSTVQMLRKARSKFSAIENRLRAMESHVTSSRFELQRELKKISGDE